jgi:hypothetical protein
VSNGQSLKISSDEDVWWAQQNEDEPKVNELDPEAIFVHESINKAKLKKDSEKDFERKSEINSEKSAPCSLNELRKRLGESAIIASDRVQAQPGCPTDFAPLDRYLLWNGFPKGALSLLSGEAGLGATRLWLQAATHVTQQNRWAAWVNGIESELNCSALKKVQLDKLLWVSAPVDIKQKLWALQELASLCLFEIIGCDLESHLLRDHQILKLKKIAIRYKVALILISRVQKSSPFFSLAIEFDKNNMTVVRALHRAPPHVMERRELYADTLPLLASGRSALSG